VTAGDAAPPGALSLADGVTDGPEVPTPGRVGVGVGDEGFGRGERDECGVAVGLADGVGVVVRVEGDHLGVTDGAGFEGAERCDCPWPWPWPCVPVLATPVVPDEVGGGRTETHSASTPRNSTVSTTVEVRGRPTASRHRGRPRRGPDP
jgi:hypothetical protein